MDAWVAVLACVFSLFAPHFLLQSLCIIVCLFCSLAKGGVCEKRVSCSGMGWTDDCREGADDIMLLLSLFLPDSCYLMIMTAVVMLFYSLVVSLFTWLFFFT